MRLVNNAIKRLFTQIPTMEDVKAKFAGATRFSKLDLKEAYHQLELTPKSRNLTAFYGPDGLYRYKRLNYGTKSAQDILQIQMQKMLVDVPHQVNIADDILIGGSPEEHDSALRQVLQVLWDNGYTLNIKKCIINVEEVVFTGLLFGEKGVRPDPKNVKNLREATAPKNLPELRSFLGMAGYSMQFIPDFSKLTHPLREMSKAKKWEWTEECQASFDRLKDRICESSLLNHYIPGRETEVIVDASLTGLGAVLVQRASRNEPYQAVVYKSRTLKEVESRYLATERESLGIHWAVKKLRHYLLGASPFKVVTDHKPLVHLFGKTTGDTPPRVERFVMDLQEFDYQVVYRPGRTCIADYNSRHPSIRTGSSRVEEVERVAKRIAESRVLSIRQGEEAVTLDEIKKATEECPLLVKLKEAIHTGRFDKNDVDLKPYINQEVKSQLNIIDGIVCRGSRIVVPRAL